LLSYACPALLITVVLPLAIIPATLYSREYKPAGRDNGEGQDDSDEQSRAGVREQRGAGIMARGRMTLMSREGKALESKEGQG